MKRFTLSLPLFLAGCFSPTGSGGLTGSDPGSSSASPGVDTTPDTSGPAESSTTSLPITTGKVSSTSPDVTSSNSSEGPPTTSGPTSSPTTGTGDPVTSSSGGSEPVCGNMKVEEGEECDDGNVDEEAIDGCSPVCIRDALFAFVTSTQVAPTFMGPLEADSLCTSIAGQSGLPGQEYMAWVSDPTSDAIERMTPTDLPYLRTDFVPLLNGTDGFMNAMLWNPLDRDEDGQSVGMPMGADCRDMSFLVWTGTTSQGLGTTEHCQNWSTNALSVKAHTGLTYQTTGAWSVACMTPCDQLLRLYCFEQAPE